MRLAGSARPMIGLGISRAMWPDVFDRSFTTRPRARFARRVLRWAYPVMCLVIALVLVGIGIAAGESREGRDHGDPVSLDWNGGRSRKETSHSELVPLGPDVLCCRRGSIACASVRRRPPKAGQEAASAESSEVRLSARRLALAPVEELRTGPRNEAQVCPSVTGSELSDSHDSPKDSQFISVTASIATLWLLRSNDRSSATDARTSRQRVVVASRFSCTTRCRSTNVFDRHGRRLTVARRRAAAMIGRMRPKLAMARV